MNMTMTRRYVIVMFASLCGAIIPVVSAAQIAPGTTLVGTLDRSLNSKDVQVGQPFKLTNVNSHAYNINGGTVYGHVSKVQSAGQGRKGQILLAVDKINTRSGNIYKISGHVTDVKVETKSNAGREAGAGAGGALIGGLIGGAWGAVIGGGTGFLVAKNAHQNVTIPAGSLVTVQVDTVRRQSQ